MLAYLWDRLNELEQDIMRLKKENKEIKEQLAEIQPLKIERVEYKIQELQVETLSGTLNVGLTAHGSEKSIEQLINQMNQEGSTQFDLGEMNAVTDSEQVEPEANHADESSNPHQKEGNET